MESQWRPEAPSTNGHHTSYVLITAHPGYEQRILDALTRIPEIREINPLFGEYDIVCKIEFTHYAVLNSIVLKKIRPLPGIKDTKTMITTVFDEKKARQALQG